MNFQLVLFSGLGFLLFTGICLFFLAKTSNSNISERFKKILMLVTVIIITVSCVFIFDFYTAEYIARNSISMSE